VITLNDEFDHPGGDHDGLGDELAPAVGPALAGGPQQGLVQPVEEPDPAARRAPIAQAAALSARADPVITLNDEFDQARHAVQHGIPKVGWAVNTAAKRVRSTRVRAVSNVISGSPRAKPRRSPPGPTR
jgi:hypothetical protein